MWNLIPAAWRIWVAVAALIAVLGLLGGAYLYVRQQGYDAGYGAAQAECDAEREAQEAANRSAIQNAEKELLRQAEALSLKNMELDDALNAIDEAAGAAVGSDTLCLDAGGLQRLNTIR